MNYKISRLQAYGMSFIPVAIMLFALHMMHNYESPTQKLTLSEVSSVHLPPPPPPIQHTESLVIQPQMQLSMQPSTVALKPQPIDMNRPDLITDLDLSSHIVMQKQEALHHESIQKIELYHVGELDQSPTLVNQISHLSLPHSLTRLGINDVELIIEVEVDKQGSLQLRSVKKMDYPQLRPLIHRIIRQAKFTPPTRQGQPVRAIYEWPLRISS
tara:strand:- start:4760 stop:5401 length:642 start_codon:yes stop_codon:yes gene_type:complete